MKDWIGNTNSVFKGLGASNHCSEERQKNDYYATPRIAVEKLLEKESFSHKILEPACGELHISKVLEEYGYEVESSDIVNRCENQVADFLAERERERVIKKI